MIKTSIRSNETSAVKFVNKRNTDYRVDADLKKKEIKKSFSERTPFKTRSLNIGHFVIFEFAFVIC